MKLSGDNTLWTYHYDSRDRLIAVTQNYPGNSANHTAVSYVYDAADRRVARHVTREAAQDVDRWEFFVYDGDRPLAKFVSTDGGAPTLERRYLFAPDGAQLAESEVGFETYWILTDGQGSTSNVARWDGGKHVDFEKSRYDGNGLLRYTETPVGAVDLQLFTRYAGRPYDSLVHLADYRGRAYDPVVGRFLTSRPAAAGANGYANPDGTAEWVDPTLNKVTETTWGSATWQVVSGGGSSIYRGIKDGVTDVWNTAKSVVNAALDPIGTLQKFGAGLRSTGQRLVAAWNDPGQAWTNLKSGVGAVAQYAWLSFTNDPVYYLARGAFDLLSGAAAAKAATKFAAAAKWAAAGAAASTVGSKIVNAARLSTRLTGSIGVSGSRTTGAGIGRSKYASVQEFADAVTVKYQQLYNQGHADVTHLVRQGLIRDDRLVIGAEIDRYARVRLRDWLRNTEGIAEGRGQIIAVNRRLYDPTGSGLYRQPDVYIPGARLILDGSLMEKSAAMGQIVDFRSFSGGANVTIIRPMLPDSGSYSLLFR